MPKPDDVMATHVGPEGVLNVTGAMIASRVMRRTAVELLKAFDSEGYETYKSLKFVLDPTTGVTGATEESRAKAYSWALDRACASAKANQVRGV